MDLDLDLDLDLFSLFVADLLLDFSCSGHSFHCFFGDLDAFFASVMIWTSADNSRIDVYELDILCLATRHSFIFMDAVFNVV